MCYGAADDRQGQAFAPAQLLRLGGSRPRRGRRHRDPRLAQRRRHAGPHRRGRPDEPHLGGRQQRRARVPRGAGDDPRPRRGTRQLPRRQQGLSPAGGDRQRDRSGRDDRNLVCRDLVHRDVRWHRPLGPGGNGYPGDPRAADRDELVLPPRLLDRLDLASPQAATWPAERQRGRRLADAGRVARVRAARVHLDLPRGLRDRAVPPEPAGHLRLERRARGRRARQPVHGCRRRASLSPCTSASRTRSC